MEKTYNETGITEVVEIDFRKCLHMLLSRGPVTMSKDPCTNSQTMTVTKDGVEYTSTKGVNQQLSPLAACMVDLLERTKYNPERFDG